MRRSPKITAYFAWRSPDAGRDQLWAARRAALPALASLNNTVVLEDATVPRSRITEMLVACGNIGRKYNLVLGTFGHAGDGNLHPTILADKNNAEEMERDASRRGRDLR